MYPLYRFGLGGILELYDILQMLALGDLLTLYGFPTLPTVAPIGRARPLFIFRPYEILIGKPLGYWRVVVFEHFPKVGIYLIKFRSANSKSRDALIVTT